MKITEVTIKNYKSIKYLNFKPTPGLNAFIGENSVGKSNIIEAIYWLLGPVYPSFNAVQDEIHYLGDSDNKISIKLNFDDGQYLELAEEWEGYGGEVKSGLNLSGNYVKDEIRQNYCSAFLGIDRNINEYLPSNRWSLIGRILLHINDKFKQELGDDGELKSEKLKKELGKVRDDLLFSVKDEDGHEIMREFISILQKESASQLNKNEEEFKIDLNLYDPWNFYRTLQIIVHESDINIDFRASSLGMGVQASISVAILKAYSKIKLQNQTPIFIDEPELFLHPLAQRNFYNILRKLAENGTQVFYCTHSPDFLSAGNFDEIFIARKVTTRGTKLFNANPTDFVVDLKNRTGLDVNITSLLEFYKNACDETGASQKANEAFFAKKIILVEGSSESLVIPYLFNLLEFDYVKEGISIVKCGNKNELDRFYRLYSELGIPCFVIFDGDKQNIGTKAEEETKRQNKYLHKILESTDLSDFPDGKVHDKFIGFEYEFENNLGFEIPADCKGLALYIKVKEKIKLKKDVPEWVSEVIDNVNSLEQEDAISILERD